MTITGLLAVVALTMTVANTEQHRTASCDVDWKEAIVCTWEIVEFANPFEVRELRGTVRNEGGGCWPDAAEVTIELAKKKDHSIRHVVRVEIPSGKFKLRGVPEGEYCFRVSARPQGWACVQGQIVISRRAPKNSQIDLEVPLGK